mmetsp:Transcript_63083/g.180853  ORF Transcript_63083/g.180853 Transcript_63083/m.180853 type:complete len:232 (-) Transcript_63083:12-707(-)
MLLGVRVRAAAPRRRRGAVVPPCPGPHLLHASSVPPPKRKRRWRSGVQLAAQRNRRGQAARRRPQHLPPTMPNSARCQSCEREPREATSVQHCSHSRSLQHRPGPVQLPRNRWRGTSNKPATCPWPIHMGCPSNHSIPSSGACSTNPFARKTMRSASSITPPGNHTAKTWDPRLPFAPPLLRRAPKRHRASGRLVSPPQRFFLETGNRLSSISNRTPSSRMSTGPANSQNL